jgi:hypothetical protein
MSGSKLGMPISTNPRRQVVGSTDMLLLAPVGKWPTQRLNPKPIYNLASSCYICSKISFLENLWDYPFESTAIFTIKQNLTHTLSAELFLDKLSFGR